MLHRRGCIQQSECSPLGLADYSKGSRQRKAGWSPAVIQPHPPNSEGTVSLPNTALWGWISKFWASQVVLEVKNPFASAGYARDVGLIPGSGRFSGGGQGNPLQYSYPEIPWTEEPGGLQSMGPQRVRRNCVHMCVHIHTRTNIPHLFSKKK